MIPAPTPLPAEPATPHRGLAIEKFHPLFQRALRLEADADELLSFSTGNVPYWGLIRLALMIQLLDRAREETSARDIYLKPRAFRFGKALRYVLDSLRRSPFWGSDREVVFFCSGTNRISENGAYFNSRVDYFADCLADRRILLVEAADDLRYSWPRAKGPVSFKGGLTAPAAIWAAVRRTPPQEEARIQAFMALLRRRIGTVLAPVDYDVLERYLRRSISRSHICFRACCALLDRLKPRMIFLENAHCGGDIELIAAARERRVTTVEYQHGAINPFCPYHNFHPNVLAAGYGTWLPDYFLSYGDFWNRLLTTTATVVSIGNPHVSTMAARLAPTEAVKNSVYFLSSANAPEKYIERLRELRAEGFSVTFRPHPVERPLLKERYGTFFEDIDIAVDVSSDFFVLVPRHEFVIGDGRSTSLFEAFAIAGDRVFVMETSDRLADTFPNHHFVRTIRSARDLRSRLAEAKDPDVSIDRIFAPHWQDRFSRFVSTMLADHP
jgi:hypothetical protein